MTDGESKLAICRNTRAIAAKSFYTALKELQESGQEISEVTLRNRWLTDMRKNPSIFEDGWYIPPPHGIGVLIGDSSKQSRMIYKSLRPEEIWPKEQNKLSDEKNCVYVYASPVDRKSGIIGDWGMTLYFGKDPEVQKHMQDCLQVNKDIVNAASVGMNLSEIATHARTIFQNRGLSNEVTSTTDPAGVNIGHTVPVSYEDWNDEELQTLKEGDWRKITEMISNKRKFVSEEEKDQKVLPGMAITIEPRLTVPDKPNIPMSSYHTIVVFHTDGRKELLTNFDEIFSYSGMSYM